MRQTYIGTTERKSGAASRKGSPVLAKCRGVSGMYEEVAGTAARSIRRGLGVQRYGPSWFSVNQWEHKGQIGDHEQGSS